MPTYDYKPEMSAREAAAAFVDAWETDLPTFGIINFANADMVGHTGVIEAAVKGIETVDEWLAKVLGAVHASGGACLITADHGNADHMLEPDGSPNTAHSLNPVPVVVTVPGLTLRSGVLADVAPTMLEMLGIGHDVTFGPASGPNVTSSTGLAHRVTFGPAVIVWALDGPGRLELPGRPASGAAGVAGAAGVRGGWRGRGRGKRGGLDNTSSNPI